MSLISINNLTFRYDGSMDNVFENVSFNIDTNWKIGLIGRNGKGKTTFLKLLLGEYEYNGTISKSVQFDYFPFEVRNKDRMAIEIVNEITPLTEDWQIIKELNLLNTDAEILYRNFNLLSGGEQMKILLISLFLKGDNFLLIDEPTNHLDIETRNNLTNYLKRKKGFIVVSHDRDFLDKVVDHIISINNTNIDIEQGNFSTWQENKDRQDNFERMQNEKLKKDIDRLEIASQNTAKWSDKVEKTKYNTTNSSILNLILGNDIKYDGNIKIANDLKISYVSQSTENLTGTLKSNQMDDDVDESIFKAMLVKMGVSNKEFDKDIKQMSEGQKKKVLIAKSISQRANLYIWDEPLNYIDILTRIQIEEAILKYKPTLIFVEHDETFIKKMATKTVYLE